MHHALNFECFSKTYARKYMLRNKRRNAAIAVGILAGSIYWLYQRNKQHVRSPTKSTVAIVLTRSVKNTLEESVNDILSETENVVFILPEDDDIFVDSSVEHRLIKCDTLVGVSHILKHLRCIYNVVCYEDMPLDDSINNFLPYIIPVTSQNAREKIEKILYS